MIYLFIFAVLFSSSTQELLSISIGGIIIQNMINYNVGLSPKMCLTTRPLCLLSLNMAFYYNLHYYGILKALQFSLALQPCVFVAALYYFSSNILHGLDRFLPMLFPITSFSILLLNISAFAVLHCFAMLPTPNGENNSDLHILCWEKPT